MPDEPKKTVNTPPPAREKTLREKIEDVVKSNINNKNAAGKIADGIEELIKPSAPNSKPAPVAPPAEVKK